VGQGEGLEAADGGLAERAHAGQLERRERLAHVGLRHAQLDAPLLEALGERLQLARVGVRVRVQPRGRGGGGGRHGGVVRGGVRVVVVRVVRGVPRQRPAVVVVMVVMPPHHGVDGVVHGRRVQLVVRVVRHGRQGRHAPGVQHLESLHAVGPHLQHTLYMSSRPLCLSSPTL